MENRDENFDCSVESDRAFYTGRVSRELSQLLGTENAELSRQVRRGEKSSDVARHATYAWRETRRAER